MNDCRRQRETPFRRCAASGRRSFCAAVVMLLLVLGRPSFVQGGDGEDRDLQIKTKGPTLDAARGVQTFHITSALQQGSNVVEVLLPDTYTKEKRYRVLYVLPVETGLGAKYGDGMKEIRKLDIHNKHDVICVHPTFDTLPWYADHQQNAQRQHATYLRLVVVPVIEKQYSTLQSREGRLLLGYSKSGWGAFSLLLREPDFFGAAAAWDSPFSHTDYAKWPAKGWTDPFGSEDVFKASCPLLLLEKSAKHFKEGSPRFVLLGSANFKKDTHVMHQRMTELGIVHVHDDSLQVKHDWHSGWVAPAVDYLLNLDKSKVKGTP